MNSYNSNSIFTTAIAVLGVLFAVYLGIAITSSSTNALGETMKHVCVIAFIIAAVSPQVSIYAVIAVAAYLDYVKRLLMLYGDVNMLDVSYVLAMAPIIVGGIFLGCILRRIFEKRFLEKSEFIIAFCLGIFVFLNAFADFRSGARGMELLSGFANNAAYSLLALSLVMLKLTTNTLLRLLLTALIAFTPVAIYGFVQAYAGLNTFEIAYLKSGLTSTIYILDNNILRPFSTLNSSHAFSVAMAAMFSIAYGLFIFRMHSRSFAANSAHAFAAIIFLLACVISLGRTAWFMTAFCVIALHCFSSKRRTIALYALSAVTAILVLFNSEAILHSLPSVEALLPIDSAYSQQALSVGTFSDRLYSIRNLLTNPQFHTLFGNPTLSKPMVGERNTDELVHDGLAQAVIRFGLVGTAILIIILGAALFLIHRRLLKTTDRRNRNLAAICLATLFGFLISGLLSGSHLSVFPLNFIFWLLVGTLICATSRWTQPENNKSPVPSYEVLNQTRSR